MSDKDKKELLISLLKDVTKETLENIVVEKQVEIVELKEKIEEDAEKVDFYESAMGSDSLIEMSAVAKILNFYAMGRNKLFSYLRNKRILRYNNEPYQEYQNRGYFEVREQAVDLPYGETMINRKSMVTQKGLDYIRKILLEDGYGYNNQ